MAKHQKGENRTRTIQNDVKMHVTVGRAKLRMTSRNARIPSTESRARAMPARWRRKIRMMHA